MSASVSRLPIYFCRFLDALSFTIFFPLVPFLTKELGLDSIYIGLLLSIYGVGQFFGAPILGAMSDKFGRKKILLACQLGSILSWIVILLLLIYYKSIPDYTGLIFLFARFLDGITGGNAAVTSAIIAEEKDSIIRRQMFSTSSASFAAGLVVGPALGAFAMNTSLGVIGYGLAGLILTVCTLIFTFFGLQNSVSFLKDLEINYNPFKILLETKSVERLFINTRLVMISVYHVFISVASLHLITVFGLTLENIALYFTFMGLFRIFNNLVIIRFLRKVSDDFIILKIGSALLCVASIGLAFADNIYVFFITSYLLALGNSFTYPVIHSIGSSMVEKDRLGVYLGSDSSMNAVSITLVPTIAVFFYESIGSYIFIVSAINCILIKLYFDNKIKLFRKPECQSTNNC